MKLRRPKIHSPFTALYAEIQATPERTRSIRSMFFANLFGNLHAIICASGTTAMIQLANFLGAGDFEYGALTAIPLAAAVFQIPFSQLVSRTHKRKKYILTIGLFSRVLWLVIGLIPFILPMDPKWLRLWTVLILLGISSVCGSMINVCWFPWMADIVPMRIRGRWMSRRDAIVQIFNVLFGLFVSFLLDRMPGEIKYTVVFTLGAIFGMMDMLMFTFVEEVYSTPPVKTKIAKSIGTVLHDRRFMRFVVFWTAWCFTANMSGMYISRYALNELGMTNTQVTLCGSITACAVTMIAISQWGKIMDRYGCKPVMLICGIVASLTQGFFLFASYGQIWMMIAHNFFGAMFWCGSNLAATNMQLSYSSDEQRPAYIALFSCLTSLFGAFAGIMVGGAALDWMESIGVPGLGGFDRYKILIATAITLRFSVVLFLVPKMDNDRDKTTKEMLQDFSGFVRRKLRRRKSAY